MNSDVARRIVFFTDKMSPTVGGMEAHADAFIEHFSTCADWELSMVLTFKREPINNSLPANSLVLVKFLSENSVFDPCEVYAILDELHLAKNDVIFFNSLYWVRILVDLRKRYIGVRMIMRSGGNDIMQSQIDGNGETLVERQAFVVDAINKNIDHLFVNSKYSFERFSRLGINPIKMVVAPGGVDVERFYQGTKKERDEVRKELSLPDNSTLILTVCRLVEFKGLRHTIEAISMLPASLYFHCLIIGDGPLKERVKLWINSSQNGDLITLLDSISHEKVSRYFRASDIYCQTPIYHVRQVDGGEYVHTETMGRSFCEAAASALPSVGTYVGGVSEIIHDKKTGFLVPENSPRDIAKKLETLLSDSILRKEMGNEARKISETKYSWEILFALYIDVFQK